jgi:hypothetical protein
MIFSISGVRRGRVFAVFALAALAAGADLSTVPWWDCGHAAMPRKGLGGGKCYGNNMRKFLENYGKYTILIQILYYTILYTILYTIHYTLYIILWCS